MEPIQGPGISSASVNYELIEVFSRQTFCHIYWRWGIRKITQQNGFQSLKGQCILPWTAIQPTQSLPVSEPACLIRFLKPFKTKITNLLSHIPSDPHLPPMAEPIAVNNFRDSLNPKVFGQRIDTIKRLHSVFGRRNVKFRRIIDPIRAIRNPHIWNQDW